MVIKQVTDLARQALDQPQKYKGFMGVSIRNKFFSHAVMERYFKWASQYFSEFIVFLIDDPDRHNFMVFKNLSEEESLEKARAISNFLKVGYERVLKQRNIQNVRILQFRDFIHDPLYHQALSSLHSFISKNSTFKENLYQVMQHHIGNRLEHLSSERPFSSEELIRVKERLSYYLVAELASLLYFTQKDYPIEIDPTQELETKRLLYDGQFPEFMQYMRLTKRGHVYIFPKGTSYQDVTYKPIVTYEEAHQEVSSTLNDEERSGSTQFAVI